MQNTLASQTFNLIVNNLGATIHYTGNEQVVKTAIDILIQDSRLVCAQPFAITEKIVDRSVIIGIPGQDSEFDRLLTSHNIVYSDLQGKWEAFKIIVVETIENQKSKIESICL